MDSFRSRLGKVAELVRRVRLMPKVYIDVYGGSEERAVYRELVRRHPKFPLVRNKEVGVALAKVPDSPNGALSGPRFHRLRGGINKARKAGYRIRPIAPLEHIEEILQIHRSSDERQGSRMSQAYLDPNSVRRWASSSGMYKGCFDPEGQLVAYVHYRVLGDIITLVRIIGHREHLVQGIMYLLYSEVLQDAIARQSSGERAEWIMYDTLLGASEGMSRFKTSLGFSEFWVRFRWRSGQAATIEAGPGISELGERGTARRPLEDG